MRNLFFIFVFCGLCLTAFAQTDKASDATDISTLPSSNMELLRRSLSSSNVAGGASSAQAAPTTAPSAASTAVAAVAPVAPKPVAADKSLPAVSNKQAANTLEMPLASGAVVTTQVAPKKTAVKRSQKTNQKANAVSKPTAVAKTPTEQEIEQANALAEGEVVKEAIPDLSEEEIQEYKKKAELLEKMANAETPAQTEEDLAAQAELDYAARILQEAKQANASVGRFIPPPASKNAQGVPAPAATKKTFNPNEYRPGVEWKRSNSNHFIIYTQKRDSGIGSSNMPMIFESAYATLRRNIPWMMSDKVRVFVYQDHANYLKHEPSAKAWTRALAYPTRGEIVVYDEPGKQQELKEVFTHELVHIFTQKFFNKHNSDRLVTPVWLDEGLAVYMEDQAYNGTKGGPWSHDLRTLNLQRSSNSPTDNFGSALKTGSARMNNTFGVRKGKPVVLMPFDQFMREGSLSFMEGQGRTQDWYLQAYAMVRFLLNPSGSSSPSNRMQFEQFTRLMAQGEQVRDPKSGFALRGPDGQPVYRLYSADKALGKAYRYGTPASFEDAFWRWANNIK